MALLVVVTTVFGKVDYQVQAETTTSYTKVTSVEEITAGGEFVIIAKNSENCVALGTTIASKIDATDVTVSDDGMLTGDHLPVWTISSNDDGVKLSNGTQFLGYSSKTNFKAEEQAWKVTLGSNGFLFTSVNETTRAIAYSVGNKFGAYATGNLTNTLYVFEMLVYKVNTNGEGGESSADPGTTTCASVTSSLTPGTVEEGKVATLSCGTEGATIYYNTDGSDNYVEYTTPITITDRVTICAYAKKDGYNDSSKVTFTYTVRKEVKPLATGDKVVFYNDKAQMVMTTTPSGTKLAGVPATVTDQNTLQVVKTDTTADKVNSIAEFDVVLDAETGYYSFICGGKYLTTTATGNSISLAETASDYSLWQIYEAANGNYLLKSVHAAYNNNSQYMEYYNGFTVYGLSATGSEAAYVTSFYGMPTIVNAPSNPVITPETGVVEKNTTVTIDNSTENAVIYYTVDGSDPSKESNANRKEYTSNTELVVTDACTIKAVACKDGVYSDVVSAAYTIAVKEQLVKDGTYVIYNPAYKKALSATKTGYYNVGVEMTLNENNGFDKVETTELWTVKNNEDGTLTISNEDGVLSMAASNSSLANNAVNDKWAVEKQEDGSFYIKNIGRNTFLEWYSSKSNYSTYNTIKSGSEDLFKMKFVPALAGSGKVSFKEQLTTGTYVMVSKDGYAPTKLNGNWVEVAQPVIEHDIVTDAKGTFWTLTVTGKEVMLTDGSHQTIAPTGGANNGIKEGAYKWAWTFNETNGTFTLSGQGADTVTLCTNATSEHKIKAYKNATAAGSNYGTEFTLYKVELNTKEELPTEGSKIVLYNAAAQGVLAAQDDNVESPSVLGVSATVTDGKATVSNGGAVFEVKKNGDFYRFYNETYGYLCSKGTGNNAYYSSEACEEADWVIERLGGGFKLKSNAAKYVSSSGSTSAQYMEYFSGSYKTYSLYITNKDGTPADTSIYEFHFYPVANKTLTGGIVNEPSVVTDTLLDAYVGLDYKFSFKVDAPFGVKELNATLGGDALTMTEETGTYTVNIPSAKISGQKLTVNILGEDNKGVAIKGSVEITVKDEPVISNVAPKSGSETGDNKKPEISADIANAGENPTVTMTVNDQKVNAVYQNGRVSYTSASDMEDGRYNVTVTVKREDNKEASKTWAFTVGEANFQLYFGQLHSHTTFSDGSGSLASALDYVKNLPDSANVDFVAFTDHSNYFDSTSAVNPEAALYDMSLATADSQTKWKEYKDTVEAFNENQSDVVAVAGFEMTWSGGPGHMNTFNTPGVVSRNNATLNNKTKDAGMKAYYTLLSQAEGSDLVAQFNHPGATFGTFAVPSFWLRYTSALVMPSSARLLAKPLVKRSATCQSAALRMVAFSRSMRPMEPISLETEMCTSSPMTSRQRAAASSSWSLRTVENTPEMAMDLTPLAFMSRKKARAASRSKGASSLPSYSKPPPMTAQPTQICRMSSAQSTMGGMPRVAGAPSRRIPMGARFLRSTMALVHWVVPSMACLIWPRSTPDTARTVRRAARMPS